MWRPATNQPAEFVTLPFLNWEVNRVVAAMACLTPALLPVIWISGITLFWVLLVALANCLRWQRFSQVEWAFATIAGLLILGLVAGQTIGAPGDRTISSIYHLSHWFVLLAFMNIGRFVTEDPRNHDLFMILSKGAIVCLVIMLAYMFSVAWYMSSAPLVPVQFPSLIIGKLAPQISFLSGYQMIEVIKINTISSGFEWRLSGFGLWTSEGAYLASIVGLFAMIYSYSRFGITAVIAIEIAVLFALDLAGSRTSSAAYILSLGIWFALMGRYWKIALILAIPVMLGAVVFFFSYGIEILDAKLAEAYKWRQDSSGARFVSYLAAIELVMDRNPITGLGYLPMMPELVDIPIGSHSSWTSILAKGGLVALAAFVVAQMLLAGKMMATIISIQARAVGSRLSEHLNAIILVRCAMITMLSWFTEDLDGPAAGAALAGLAIGLFLGMQRLQVETGQVPGQIRRRTRWR